MVKLKISEKTERLPFLRPSDIANEVVAEIAGSGEFVKINIQGVEKEIFRMPVKIGDKQYLYSPNKTSIITLINAFGDETANWIGKKILLKKVTFAIRGKPKDGILATAYQED